jgi:thiamine kinase-like enzyme
MNRDESHQGQGQGQVYQCLGGERWHGLPDWLKKALSHSSAQASRLSAGLSNDNFRLGCDQGDWVLRDNRPENVWCDRVQELHNWHRAESAGIAPKLVWVSDDKRFYLSQYIEQSLPWSNFSGGFGHQDLNRPIEPILSTYHTDTAIDTAINTYCDAAMGTGAETEAGCDVVAALLKVLQDLMLLPLPEKSLTPRVQWQDYSCRLVKVSESLAGTTQLQRGRGRLGTQSWQQAFAKIVAMKDDIDTWLRLLEDCAVANQFCHRDLNPHNLLYTQDLFSHKPKLMCIDFEYATASHPLFELASLVCTHKLTQAQVDALTEQYIAVNSNLNHNALAAMPAAINCYWLCCAAWALLMAAELMIEAVSAEKNMTVADRPSEQYVDYFNQYIQLITI